MPIAPSGFGMYRPLARLKVCSAHNSIKVGQFSLKIAKKGTNQRNWFL
jgi:hypothetical protein